jgi:hypothetical protein
VKGVWFEGTRSESAPIARTARENTTRIESVLFRIRGSTERVVRNGGDTDTIVKGNDSLSARTPPGTVLWMLAAQAYSHDKQNNSIPVARFILNIENKRGKKIVRFDILRFGYYQSYGSLASVKIGQGRVATMLSSHPPQDRVHVFTRVPNYDFWASISILVVSIP